MGTKFYIYNELENGTLSASSENASFPLENLKDVRRTKTFRSNSGSDSVVVDLGSNRPLDSFFIVDNPASGFGISTLTFEANPTNVWTSPLVSQSVSLDTTNGIGVLEFTSANCRFVRLVMTSTLGYCELSNFFIGTRTEYADFDISYPVNFQWNNLSTVSKNRYGQRFIDEVTTQRIVSGSLENMNQSEMDSVSDWVNYISNTIPFFIRFDAIQAITNPNKLNGFYYLNSEPKFILNRGNFWSCDLSLEEAL